jgi:hypothetical protein
MRPIINGKEADQGEIKGTAGNVLGIDESKWFSFEMKNRTGENLQVHVFDPSPEKMDIVYDSAERVSEMSLNTTDEGYNIDASGLVAGDSGGNTSHGAAEGPGAQPSNEAAASSNSLTHQPFRLASGSRIEGTGAAPAGEIPPDGSLEIRKRHNIRRPPLSLLSAIIERSRETSRAATPVHSEESKGIQR